MKSFVKKNKKIVIVLYLVIIIVVCIGAFLLIHKNKNQKENVEKNEVYNKNYSLKYDDTWKIEKLEANKVLLNHKKSNGSLIIEIKELENEVKYKDIDEIFDSFLFNILEENKEYRLLYKEKEKITENDLNGYIILLENDVSQAEIYLYKQGGRIVVGTYEAANEYFDILLDSANKILDSFSLKEQTFDVTTDIKLETKEITYTKQEEISNLLKDVKQEKIADKNYTVDYTIPSNFTLIEYNTKGGRYEFSGISSNENITLRTSIYNRNLYEYLDKENSVNIYDNYNINSYNKSNEMLNKFSDKPLSYIYKNSYLTDNKLTENIEIVYELNENHIMRVVIESKGVGIPEELVKMIKISNIENYASNISIEKEEDLLIGKMKRFVDYNYDKTEEIKLKIPENYVELDREQNLYEERIYATSLNEEMQIYEYEVKYRTISFDIESELEILSNGINKQNGEYKEFSNVQNITLNNKTFNVYERGYTSLSNVIDKDGNKFKYYSNEKVLFYELQNNSYLVIIITDNKDNNISTEMLKQLTNFEINIE